MATRNLKEAGGKTLVRGTRITFEVVLFGRDCQINRNPKYRVIEEHPTKEHPTKEHQQYYLLKRLIY
ncbi:hypothetical protein JFL43_16260 [Viridibacillus sp. YIM B01967]|uniref:50S ribosomal protein L33 n=1 Tax=Viridibacillus soli TaxID=2798301 RepID=A0ABS1HAD8_9BACL|nr:hypothetical protein [Viridibacillus soli]MBK3496384.1 hypothetical protein [Viridibacillus soli]